MTDGRGQWNGEPPRRRFRLRPVHTIIGGGVVAAACALLLAGAYVGPLGKGAAPTGDRPALAVVPVDAKPVAITPGEKMDVLTGAEDGFQGVPRPEREPGLAEMFADAFMPDEPEPRLAPRPAPARVEVVRPGPMRPEIARPDPVRIEQPLPPRIVEAPPLPPRASRQASSRSGDCTYEPTRVQAMICRDSRLAQADATLRGAMRNAIDGGADVRDVMRDQRRWEAARERAAIDGPGAVEHLYRLRIEELQTGY